MKLDPEYLNYISRDELRILTAIEMGMRNHQFVPVQLIESISHLKRANAYKILQMVLKQKLIVHYNKKYSGYKLTFLGYDYLALYAFIKRGHIKQVLKKIGVGKESDIYSCVSPNNEPVILKLQRLGRVSFKTVKNNRDYLNKRTQYNWLYLSRLASLKEFTYMKKLYENGFPVPVPIDWNRHGVVMSLVDGYNLNSFKEIENAQEIYNGCIEILLKLAENGLIHSDYNEFNIMLNQAGKITVIDFPQIVSMSHLNAKFYFERDLKCIELYFKKKCQTLDLMQIKFDDIKVVKRLDIDVKASGFIKNQLIDTAELSILEKVNEEMFEVKSQQEDEGEDAQYEDDENYDNDDEDNQQQVEVQQKEANQEEQKEEDEEDENDQNSSEDVKDESNELEEEETKLEKNEEEEKKTEKKFQKKNNEQIDEKEYIQKVVQKNTKKKFSKGKSKNHPKQQKKVNKIDYFF